MTQTIHEDFRGELHPPLSPLEMGTGRIERADSADRFRLVIGPTVGKGYSDAQLFDYWRRKRRDFRAYPPLRMVVRAWASHGADQLLGTAGFGFWNQPVMPGQFDVRLPRAVWFFFGSPPSNMAFARGVPGYGWKAATLDTSRASFLALAPTAPVGFLLMRIPALYRLLWPIAQRAIGASEKLVPVSLTQPHTYRLDWLERSVSFYVDDELLMHTSTSPRGPLGFVVWIDNQYAVVTPQGNIQMGLIDVPHAQWLALDFLTIEPI